MLNSASYLWAKFSQSNPGFYHPLWCHALDVSAVTWALWQNGMPRAFKRFVCQHLGLAEQEEVAGKWLAFWAGLHDIGKASPVFQSKNQVVRQLLNELGYSFPSEMRQDIYHPKITRYVISKEFSASLVLGNASEDTKQALGCCLGGHHGQFPSGISSMPGTIGTGIWQEARQEIAQQIAHVIGIKESLPAPQGLQACDHAFFMILAGLVCVADWIASDEDFFPYRPLANFSTANDYWLQTKQQAVRAIENIGWTSWQPASEAFSLETLLQGKEPRPLQLCSAELTQNLQEPTLILIEAPTGEGKTEAAIYLADHWNWTLQQRGIYFALPTQATANAMYRRFWEEYLCSRYADNPPPLHLLHGHAFLLQDQEQAIQSLQIYDEEAENSGQVSPFAPVVQEWFSYKKRGLLGPLGVGTVDQALLGVLQTKHGFVRLLGLASKTLILDEVHAYDVYTSTLIERLLEWLRALGSSVVLLSATLPAQQRQKLLRAYGANDSLPSQEAEGSYPSVTVVQENSLQTRPFVATPQSPICLGIKSIEKIIDDLKEVTQSGGCVAWICNTVNKAQQVYSQLKEEFAPQGVSVELFHARYPLAERLRRETRAQNQYGKNSVQRPQKAILVATQVIEQSLDVDFDLLISEVAPIDLLLQRAGRLHRHSRQRPQWLQSRQLWLITPQMDENEVPMWGDTAHIYEKYVLLRTWLVLQQYGQIRIPEDVQDLIEKVYGDAPATQLFPRLTQAWEKCLEKAKKDMIENQNDLNMQAKVRLIHKPHIENSFPDFVGQWENLDDDENPELHKAFLALTRYSKQPSYTIVCLTQQEEGSIGLETENGFHTIDLEQPPQQEELKALINRSVSLSLNDATQYLKDKTPPTGWRRCALLRYARAVVFNTNGNPVDPNCPLRLDPELGLVLI